MSENPVLNETGEVRPAWSTAFRRSRSSSFAFTVRSEAQTDVWRALNDLGTCKSSGWPGGGGSEYSWDTPWGRAECVNGWGQGMWVETLELLLVLCDRLRLRRPRVNPVERADGALRVIGRMGGSDYLMQ